MSSFSPPIIITLAQVARIDGRSSSPVDGAWHKLKLTLGGGTLLPLPESLLPCLACFSICISCHDRVGWNNVDGDVFGDSDGGLGDEMMP
jgi:hypothetical protein